MAIRNIMIKANPTIIQALAASVAPIGQPASTPVPTPATPAGAPPSIQALLTAIPTALDGQIVTTDHHNTLRAALIAIANSLGVAQAENTSITFAPAFNQIGTQGWISNGFFSAEPTKEATFVGAGGWMPVNLPDGQKIISMTVFGKRTPLVPFNIQLGITSLPTPPLGIPDVTGKVLTIGIFLVILSRQGHVGGDPVGLATADLTGQSGTFQVKVPFKEVKNVSDAQVVNVKDFSYNITALMVADPAAKIEIDAIQIEVGP